MFKRTIISICIIGLLLSNLTIFKAHSIYINTPIADQIWSYLIEETGNEKITASIMGYFWRESHYKSDAIPFLYLYEKDICSDFTENLYDLNKEEFVQTIQAVGGYGMGQWYSKYHLENFYDWFNEHGYKYDDIEGQCKFVVWEIKLDEVLWEQLQVISDVYYVGLLLGAKYDGASEMSRHVIGFYTKQIYLERIKNDYCTEE